MLAFTLEKAERCQMCGTAEWEWERNPRAYEAVDRFCRGCWQRDSRAKESEDSPGVTVELAPTGTQAWAQRFLRAKKTYLSRGGRSS
jgi:hypothetical protein